MVTIEKFGETSKGEDVYALTLKDGAGNSAVFLNYGATMQSFNVALSRGRQRDICLGYDTIKEYEENNGCFGGTIGRCVNRIVPPEVTIDGKLYHLDENRPNMHIHGGSNGFHQKIWSAERDGNIAVFRLTSADGENGYPGALTVEVKIWFAEAGLLEMQYDAYADHATIINLTNHSYFNLDGHNAGAARLQKLSIFSTEYATIKNGIPDGNRATVFNSPMNFVDGRTIYSESKPPLDTNGYDLCYLLKGRGIQRVATITAQDETISMDVYADFPAIQFYDGWGISPRAGKNGAVYTANSGICLEPEYVPNAVHIAAFEKPIFSANTHFRHTIRYCLRSKCRE